MNERQLKRMRRLAAGLLILGVGLTLAGWTVLRAEQRGSPSYLHATAAAPSASLREVLAHPDIIASHRHPLLGLKAPDVTLTDCEGQSRTLQELQAGHALVLIFSYGICCKNCVRSLSAVDRQFTLFQELDARVVAVIPDPPANGSNPFAYPILVDSGNRTVRAYRAVRGGELRHGTFVLDRQGVIRWANVGDAPFQRVSALLTQVALIEGKLSH